MSEESPPTPSAQELRQLAIRGIQLEIWRLKLLLKALGGFPTGMSMDVPEGPLVLDLLGTNLAMGEIKRASRRKMTPSERKAHSERMKQFWAQRKAAAQKPKARG